VLLALALLTAAARPAPGAAVEPEAPLRDDEAGPPPEMSGGARALYERGLALYRTKDYANAIKAFEEGFALEPRGEFLFANAQARRLAGDCRGAVPLYQRFLDTAPPAVQASATHIALARCARQMAAERPAAPLVIAPPPLPPPPPPPPPPWTHDRWGAALLGMGVVGLAVGGGFLAASFAALPDGGARTYAGYDGARSTAESRHAIAVGGLVAGGAFVAAGVARYAWVRHERRARATLTIVPGGLALGGWFCALGGRF
jgi:tetratricopeptide (TPR) repeat protein